MTKQDAKRLVGRIVTQLSELHLPPEECALKCLSLIENNDKDLERICRALYDVAKVPLVIR